MTYEKCPNCGGTTSISSDGSKAICDFCGSEFVIDADLSGRAPFELFILSNLKPIGNDFCKKSFGEMCALVNGGETFETCMKALRETAKEHSDWVIDGTHSNLSDKVKKHLGASLPADETILLFKDSGIIATGKSGVLITNQTIISYNKKHIYKLAIKDIRSIHILELIMNSGEWYFNANKNFMVDNMACSPTEQGMIMALICLLAKKYNGSGYRILVHNGVI